MRGTIKWYNSTAGYGFITLVGLRGDVFVSAHQVAKAGLDGLAAGDEVAALQAAGQLSLLGGRAPECKSEGCYGNGRERGEGPVIFVNEGPFTHHQEWELGTVRDRLIQLGLFTCAVVAFVAGCALLVRR
jgi:cold shock CspA family protein